MAKSPPCGHYCIDCEGELTRAEHKRGHTCSECDKLNAVELMRWKYGEDNVYLDEEMQFGKRAH